ncbi:hypothetical protein HanPI659440_Chr09g0350471 [Helianthus annuus]|nr:hypothetical protein HanPI659440_Chr09g0350471 [Helianthus annuus]
MGWRKGVCVRLFSILTCVRFGIVYDATLLIFHCLYTCWDLLYEYALNTQSSLVDLLLNTQVQVCFDAKSQLHM